jgi:predicted permease
MADALQQRVAALPSVTAAGLGSAVPPAGEFQRASLVLPNGTDAEPVSHIVTMVPASPGYFTTLQIALLRGRLFNDGDAADRARQRSVIVSREAAKRFFGNDDPIGRTLPLDGGQVTVVGVVEDVRYSGVANKPEPTMYRPFSQDPSRIVVLYARTAADSRSIAGELREMIQGYDRDISIMSIQPLTELVSSDVAQPRFRTLLLSAVAVITLLLAMVGLYGVIAYSTAQRTSEIGLRVAIGARQVDVVRLVLLEGGRLAIAGTVIGVAAAYASTRVLSSFLYQVPATDPAAFAGSAIALLFVSLMATYIPARRAARVDPMTALRAE